MSITIVQTNIVESYEVSHDGGTVKFTRSDTPEGRSIQLGNMVIKIDQPESDLSALVSEVAKKRFPAF